MSENKAPVQFLTQMLQSLHHNCLHFFGTKALKTLASCCVNINGKIKSKYFLFSKSRQKLQFIFKLIFKNNVWPYILFSICRSNHSTPTILHYASIRAAAGVTDIVSCNFSIFHDVQVTCRVPVYQQ